MANIFNYTTPTPFSSPISNAILAMCFLEAVPVTLLLFASVLNAAMLCWHSAFLHHNLRAILLTQSSFIIVYACMRIVFYCYHFADPNESVMALLSRWTVYILPMDITLSNLIGHIMIVERTLATMNVRNYEHNKGFGFTLTWMTMMFIFALLLTMFPSLNGNGEFGIALFSMHFALLLSAVEMIAFGWLIVLNKKQYNLFRNIHTNFTHNYHLSERYQLRENIYSGRQLAPSFFLHLVNICTANAVCFFFVYFPLNHPWIDLFFMIIFVIHTFAKLGIEITVIILHPVLRRKLARFCSKLFPFRLTSSTQVGCQRAAETNDGYCEERYQQRDSNQVEMRENRTQKDHFDMLEHFWK